MTWRDPTDLERFLLEDTRERWPEVLPLARCLTLAPRIEPLLLRNARRRFVPQAQAEVESQLWFSPLVATRSTREIVLHLGIARILAEELKAAPAFGSDSCEPEAALRTVWEFTCLHTRHWTPEDRLERDLRYHALRGDDLGLRDGIRAILRRIAAETDEAGRLALARVAKRTFPAIASALGPCAVGEARLLARYAALALGDTGAWLRPGPPAALPERLAARLPKRVGQSDLGVEIRWDAAHGQVLHLTEARDGEEPIRLPSPLPGSVHVAAEGESGDWHVVSRGTRIPIDPPSPALRLTTLDGRQWTLVVESLPKTVPVAPSTPEPLLVAHVEADLEQARAIADWLRTRGIPVELLAEGSAGAVVARGRPQTRMVRLWTRSARGYWTGRQVEQAEVAGPGLLLRTEPIEPPEAGVAPGRILDWQDLDWRGRARLADTPRSEALLRALEGWWREGEIPPRDELRMAAGEGRGSKAERPIPTSEAEDRRPAKVPGAAEREAEIARLLKEIADPKTEPPRRLAIGDRLAELGDPRPGVGTVEIEVLVEDEPEPVRAEETVPADTVGRAHRRRPSYGPEIDALLAEIDDPKTEPPRRLVIGDRLAELGDPRRGVGLDARGLPDIDWVEVPAGPFYWQDGAAREQPGFWIGRYPITNAQFNAFIDDGYSDWRMWKDVVRPGPAEPRWGQPNRPRTDVDWYEAVAFTRWLTVRLGLPSGTIRLPTDFEWERAARGDQGRIYPWGNEFHSGYANLNEVGGSQGQWYLGHTTAVGLYPHGRSPYGVEDLAGTVWEWCLNKYDDFDDSGIDNSGDSRVLRGGSWSYIAGGASAEFRNMKHPGTRGDNTGLRLVSAMPIDVVR